MITIPPPPTPTTPTPTPHKSKAHRNPSSQTHADPPNTKTCAQNPLRNRPATAESIAAGRKGIRSGSAVRKMRRGIRLIGGVARRVWVPRVWCRSIWGSKGRSGPGGGGGFGPWRRLVSLSLFFGGGGKDIFSFVCRVGGVRFGYAGMVASFLNCLTCLGWSSVLGCVWILSPPCCLE